MGNSFEDGANRDENSSEVDFEARASTNQQKLKSNLRTEYDFIVCGSGSSGSVVARRLAENPDVSVLLIEAGGSDDLPAVMNPAMWTKNWGTELDWKFLARPAKELNGRSPLLTMGKVLGGGSSINAMIWSHGHKNDWDFFAAEADDQRWSHESVLQLYRRIESWHGLPDSRYRGTAGPVFVQSAQQPSPLVPAFLEGARSLGITGFDSPNAQMMETEGGSSALDLCIRDERRVSIFRSYVHPYLDRPNLTVLTHALVTRLTFSGSKVTGVEVNYENRKVHFRSAVEVVVSLGAIQTPKLLMQSGLGDETELKRFGIPVIQHLPGVGKNLQQHWLVASCIWESNEPLEARNNACEAAFFSTSDRTLDTPNIMGLLVERPPASPEAAARYSPPANFWTIVPALIRPASVGSVSLTGSAPDDPTRIETNVYSDPRDMKAMVECVRVSRELGNSESLKTFAKREAAPGNLSEAGIEDFIRNATRSYFHETCTAKMGRDAMSVVDGQLKVYGIEGLRIADGSILPRITTGHTMAPCVVIGEQAGDLLRMAHDL